jgi:hypothetical protein
MVHSAKRRNRKGWVVETSPVKISFNAKEEVTRLKVIADLSAPNEFRYAPIKIVAGDCQGLVSPSSAEVGSQIKS